MSLLRRVTLSSGNAGLGKLALLFLFVTVPLVAVALAVVNANVSAQLLFRDLAAVAGYHPFTGAISTLGLLAWAAASAIWLCAAFLASMKNAPYPKSYASASALTAYLMVDDAFMIHESIFPKIAHQSEVIFLISIAVAALIFAFLARSMLLRTPLSFSLCILMLPLSMAIDVFPVQTLFGHEETRLIVEDVTKWIGIIGWMMGSFWHFLDVVGRTSD